MGRLGRALVPLAAVVTFAVLSLLRCQAEPIPLVPRESELAELLGDLGSVRAWSDILGDRGEPPLPAADGSWDETAHYLLTGADGRTGVLSVAIRGYPSAPEAGTSFDRLAAQLGASGGARPVASAGAAEPEQRQDFGGMHAAAGGWQPDARARLLREGRVVALVRLVAAPAAGGWVPGWREGQAAFERTAAWVQDRMLQDRAGPGRARR